MTGGPKRCRGRPILAERTKKVSWSSLRWNVNWSSSSPPIPCHQCATPAFITGKNLSTLVTFEAFCFSKETRDKDRRRASKFHLLICKLDTSSLFVKNLIFHKKDQGILARVDVVSGMSNKSFCLSKNYSCHIDIDAERQGKVARSSKYFQHDFVSCGRPFAAAGHARIICKPSDSPQEWLSLSHGGIQKSSKPELPLKKLLYLCFKNVDSILGKFKVWIWMSGQSHWPARENINL